MAKKHAKLFHYELYGKREEKYNFLDDNSMYSIDWKELKVKAPNFFFVYKDDAGQKEYEKGFKIDELFLVNTSGIKTHNDKELVSFEAFTDFNQKYDYRPFDTRFINYDLKKVQRHRFKYMRNFIVGENIGLCLMRQLVDTEELKSVFITKVLMDINLYRFQSYLFPLYLYPASSDSLAYEKAERVPNLNMQIVEQIAKILNLRFVPDEKLVLNKVAESDDSFTPLDILDYIYAVLHSPTYRKKYKEFLKIDFPKVPYPKNQDIFWQLVKLGGEIRQIHLLESPVVEQYSTQFPIIGDNLVKQAKYENGKVYINANQYFDNVSPTAWEFYIGGYQAAQKWLKDRKNRNLDFDDILHYQKIIVALTETERLMKEIDKIVFN